MGGQINVDSQGVRRAANGKLADAADGTGRIAARLEGLGGGGQLGGSGAAAAFAGREQATQGVFAGALRHAHQELTTHRDSLLVGMAEYDRADDESAAATDAVATALPALSGSGITGAFDAGREQAGSGLGDRIDAADEIPMTEQEQQLADEADAEAQAEVDGATDAAAGDLPGQEGPAPAVPETSDGGGAMQD